MLNCSINTILFDVSVDKGISDQCCQVGPDFEISCTKLAGREFSARTARITATRGECMPDSPVPPLAPGPVFCFPPSSLPQ